VGSERHYILGDETENSPALKVPRQSLLVLLMQVGYINPKKRQRVRE
jgi:hypothetical protein